jgi:ubiquinone biosynthesis protein UbiJ
VGQTNETGLEIAGDIVTVPDLFATLLTGLGLDPAHEFRTEFGAIAPASDHGKVISALL